jgi:type IX secretion system PorP/SprF family membrane protein
MKKIFTYILLFFSGWAAAQQAPQYSLYMLNPYAYNPATAGLENSLILTGVYRQQWSGLKGAPVTQHINAHMPLYVISSGVGLRVENDVIGAHAVTQAVVSYNYQMELGRNSLLSLGLSGGYLQYALDGSKLRAPEGTYVEPVFSHNDLLLPDGKVRAGVPIFEIGVFAQLNKLEIGLAMQPVYAPALRSNTGSGEFSLQTVSHYNASFAYSLEVNDQLTLRPAFLVKTDIAETQTEISLVARWRENIFAGASFRGFTTSSKDAAVLLAGIKLNEKTTLAYAFDIPLSALNVANRGSHELLIRYNLNKPIGAGKLPPVIYNPRFF